MLNGERIERLTVNAFSLPYFANPTLYQRLLAQNEACSLLFESAEIESKNSVKSLFIADAALRIHCLGHEIRLRTLSEAGKDLLEKIEKILPCYPAFQVLKKKSIKQRDIIEDEMILEFTPLATLPEERERLMQPSVLDILRMIQTHFKASPFDSESNQTNHSQENALFIGGLFGYDLVAHYEMLPPVPQHQKCPDFLFLVAENLLIIDHQKQSAVLQNTQFTSRDYTEKEKDRIKQIQHVKAIEMKPEIDEAIHSSQTAPSKEEDIHLSISDDEYCHLVTQLKENIVNGDIFQVVPARTFSLPCFSPLDSYEQLKRDNPSPYMFYLKDYDFILFGASPESALKYNKKSNQVEIYPIAGTRKRGKNSDGSINLDLDGRIELELRMDTKENAEHIMLVDLARNDIAKISAPKTRYVANLLNVDRYSHVMHLVSRVVGQLDYQLDSLHAYQACMNMGTLTGAPKVRAMQLIREVEGTRRGSYGGAVGYLNGEGDLDTCIVIRSAYIEEGIAYVQAGAGVVYDSDPTSEMQETRQKAGAVLQAILKVNATLNSTERSV